MKGSSDILFLEKEIQALRQKLNKIVNANPMSSGEVLEMSKKLDELIVGYYVLKYSFEAR